jgi:branched-chain amino acid transport system substrate-binding protein
MKRFLVPFVVLAVVAAAVIAVGELREGPAPIRIGAVYPLSGPQGQGGLDEFRGVQLAADLINADGGIQGRRVELDRVDVPGSDAAAQAIDILASRGVRLVVGSYGSTISDPASAEAQRKGMLFWETGAVGSMPSSNAGGRLFFRVAPTGQDLGAAAVSFVARQLAPMFHRDPSTLRFAVVGVDDVYGRSVAQGAADRIRTMGLPMAGRWSYGLVGFDPAAVVRKIAAAHPDVLFVSAYVDDGVALRREIVRQGLHLLVNIGSSSSYCMPAFGAALGSDAIGLFASDKPDAEYVGPKALTPQARTVLSRARAAFEARYHTEMSAPALAGFSAAWALFREVLPRASGLAPTGVAAAARGVQIPVGGLPNGSGLAFAGPGSPGAGSNLRASSVIWEWVGVRHRAVVWPPRFADAAIRAIPIAP